MAFEQKEKRRPWTTEEKSAALKSCACRCACCGQKLTMKTLTMEHVIPISKGGENTLDNLVVLCEKCNKEKGNKFYWPLGYYMALNNKGKLHTIDNYTQKWVDENIDREYFKLYPMIAEGIAFFIKPTTRMQYNFKNGAYLPALIMDITELNEENCDKYLSMAKVSRNSVYKTVQERDEAFSLVAATKRSDGELLGLFTIQVCEDNLFVNEVYSTSTRVCRMIIQGLVTTLSPIWAEYGSDIVIIRTKDEKPVLELFECYVGNSISMPLRHYANSYEMFEYNGKQDCIYGKNQMLYKFLAKDDVDFNKFMCNFKRNFSENLLK